MPELVWDPVFVACAGEGGRVVGVVVGVVVVALPGGSSAAAVGATGPREPGSPEYGVPLEAAPDGGSTS